ncbi:hypothetical protein D9M70_285560 [compost metagenome]
MPQLGPGMFSSDSQQTSALGGKLEAPSVGEETSRENQMELVAADLSTTLKLKLSLWWLAI